jgi:hypothetical protein
MCYGLTRSCWIVGIDAGGCPPTAPGCPPKSVGGPPGGGRPPTTPEGPAPPPRAPYGPAEAEAEDDDPKMGGQWRKTPR